MRTLDIGGVTVERVVEAEGPSFHPTFLLPDYQQDAADEERDWLEPGFFDRERGRLIMSLHSYVIRTQHHVILVDTCVGDHKNRPSTPAWHQKEGPFLDDLRAAGVAPEAVDFVLCTHLHVDHVGWNTRLENGRWVPTFPNAKYLFHKVEYDHWAAAGDHGAGKGASDGCFEDSVLPVMDAGQAELVAGDHAIDDTLWLEPSPGHSPGHVCLHLKAGDGHAIFTGDMLHHPVQCAYPEWSSRFCSDPAQSRATRQRFVDDYADTATFVLGAHFATPTIGRIKGGPKRCRLAV